MNLVNSRLVMVAVLIFAANSASAWGYPHGKASESYLKHTDTQSCETIVWTNPDALTLSVRALNSEVMGVVISELSKKGIQIQPNSLSKNETLLSAGDFDEEVDGEFVSNWSGKEVVHVKFRIKTTSGSLLQVEEQHRSFIFQQQEQVDLEGNLRRRLCSVNIPTEFFGREGGAFSSPRTWAVTNTASGIVLASGELKRQVIPVFEKNIGAR